MSRYRNIHCLIWNDDKFPFASDACQLVFFHLITTPMSTPFGLYKASIEALAAEKRWGLKAYREAFEEAFAKGFVKYDERAQVILLHHFLKYNPPGNPNVLKAWAKPFEEIPASPLKNECYQELEALAKGISKAFLKAFHEAFAKPLPTQEQEQEQITGTDPKCERGFSRPAHAQDEEDLEQELEQEGEGSARAHTQDILGPQGQDAVVAYTFPAQSPAAGYTPPADFAPTDAMLALASKDAPHVDLSLVTKLFRSTCFTRAVLDWSQRWYKFVLEEEARAPTRRNGSAPPRLSYVEAQRVREEAAKQRFLGGTDVRPAGQRDVLDGDEPIIDCTEYRTHG